MTVADLKVGDMVWLFDRNRRVYGKGHSPIYREHFTSYIVAKVTRTRVHLNDGTMLDRKGNCVAKKSRGIAWSSRVAFSETEVNDAVWEHDNRYLIVRAVELTETVTLRAVANLVGYKEFENE